MDDKKYSKNLPKCCDEMKKQRETSYPPEEGVFVDEDGTLIFAADGVWAVSGVKFCPWCGKAVGV